MVDPLRSPCGIFSACGRVAHALAVPMPVMKIRIVRMAVNQRPVAMGMDMRLARRIVLAMGVLVVRIMDVGMRMVERFVDMILVMPLYQLQPTATPPKPPRHDPSGRSLHR